MTDRRKLEKDGVEALGPTQFVLNINVTFIMGDDKSIKVGGAFQGTANTGDHVRITTSVSESLKDELENLTKLVDQLAKQLPQEAAEEARANLDRLKAEASRSKPNRKWYELSAEGLKEAAKAVAGIGPDVIKSVAAIVGFLGGAG